MKNVFQNRKVFSARGFKHYWGEKTNIPFFNTLAIPYNATTWILFCGKTSSPWMLIATGNCNVDLLNVHNFMLKPEKSLDIFRYWNSSHTPCLFAGYTLHALSSRFIARFFIRFQLKIVSSIAFMWWHIRLLTKTIYVAVYFLKSNFRESLHAYVLSLIVISHKIHNIVSFLNLSSYPFEADVN